MGAPPPDHGRPPRADPAVGDLVRAERLKVLLRQAPPAILVSAIVGTMVVVVLWDVTDRRRLGIWLVGLFVLALLRGVLVFAWTRPGSAARTPDEVRRREAWFVATALLVSAAWGTGGWALMPPASLAHQAMLYFFLMGLVSGSVATYGAHVGLVSPSMALIILPGTVRLFATDSIELRLMAFGGLVYVIAAYRATALLAFFLRHSFRLSQELVLAHAREQELARTDELTGLNNRRAFLELSEHAFQHAARYNRPISLILLDVDRFKEINDGRGHSAGDDVLRTLAAVVRNTVRTSDIAGRLGGEEFAVLLPETDAQAGLVMAERLRAGFAGTPARTVAGPIPYTASFGVVQRDGHGDGVEELVGRADAALYQAKRDGRDRVRLGAPSPPDPTD